MAGKRGKARRLDVEDLVELILGALSNVRRGGGNGHAPPVGDPSLNVDRQLGAAIDRVDDIGDLRFKYTTDMAELREKHQAAMATKETERLDAIRKVDTQAVAQAAAVSATQAATLATTQTTQAETLRGQVAAAATATASALASALAPLITSIESLRQAQYQQQGERQQRTEGTSAYRWAINAAIAGAGCLFLLASLLVTVIGMVLSIAWLHSIHVF